ncbi:hypothetical protein POJ06DRAFT_125329 [Lipomyces tetrasporus]|uniref:DUF4396 domain-containing protein n=1 Tax=Lipomyces tetrasporus TaxID=54092 RepID=A0AAD7QRU3_9ASCO|nr:uncharacterized protein POJ06DRAFT_125329 [Lipomyces tetrasporus]KAJ8100158.1 hypothetical protein POJ06DRAFT_125329 [Lipomyces tetrasporus]
MLRSVWHRPVRPGCRHNGFSKGFLPYDRSIIQSTSLALIRTQKLDKCGDTQTVFGSQARFWGSRQTWKRAGINTFRCLVGCTMGDFSALWFLQTNYPDIGMGVVMAVSMGAGLASSMLLETVLLRMGRDQLSWKAAATTAAGMSLVSMVAMEAVENLVDYHLTGGVVALDDPQFWIAAAISTGAGLVAPLPYNYARLRKHGVACH